MLMFSSIGSLFNELMSYGYNWIRLFFHSGSGPYWQPLLESFSIFAVWVGSGFLAATISENRGHNIWLHFAGGMLIPYIYPLALLFVLKEREIIPAEMLDTLGQHLVQESTRLTGKMQEHSRKKKLERLKAKHGTDEPEMIAPIEQEEDGGEAAETAGQISEVSAPDRDYFDSLAVNELGERVGPFILTMKNGSEIIAEKIAGTQAALAIFEIVDKNGQAKRIRIRYDNIESCRKGN